VALGDDKQCTAISAGAIIDLSRRALGAEQVPEILTTRRQKTEREQQIAGLFREGRVAEALDMKRADRTAEMVYGGHDGVVARVAQLYLERLEATGVAPSISAPTNSDAQRIGEAVRAQRRDMGLLGEDVWSVRATDGERDFTLRLAAGDQVRLFKAVGAKYAQGRGGSIGRNGSVLEVVGRRRSRHHPADDRGITLRSKQGKVGVVRMGSPTHQARPGSIGLWLLDNNPHGTGVDQGRAHHRSSGWKPSDRRPPWLLIEHAPRISRLSGHE
jgi:hypothetical protein